MVKKDGKFSYDISKFEKEINKIYKDEEIIVGAMEGVDEKLIQAFFDNVLEYEKNYNSLYNIEKSNNN